MLFSRDSHIDKTVNHYRIKDVFAASDVLAFN